jgi:hypothetical protein
VITDHMPNLSTGLCLTRPDAFEDINTLAATRAAQICLSGCPVFNACRDWGVRHEIHGCWGGLAEKRLAAERRRLGIELDEIRNADYAPRARARTGARS